MDCFYKSYRLKNLMKDPTCFKNSEIPSCIDPILTNSHYSFRNSYIIETGLSDFHKMIVSVMKTTFQKLSWKISPNLYQYTWPNGTKGKNTYVAIICHFLIQNYLGHTKKNATKKSLSQNLYHISLIFLLKF